MTYLTFIIFTNTPTKHGIQISPTRLVFLSKCLPLQRDLMGYGDAYLSIVVQFDDKYIQVNRMVHLPFDVELEVVFVSKKCMEEIGTRKLSFEENKRINRIFSEEDINPSSDNCQYIVLSHKNNVNQNLIQFLSTNLTKSFEHMFIPINHIFEIPSNNISRFDISIPIDTLEYSLNFQLIREKNGLWSITCSPQVTETKEWKNLFKWPHMSWDWNFYDLYMPRCPIEKIYGSDSDLSKYAFKGAAELMTKESIEEFYDFYQVLDSRYYQYSENEMGGLEIFAPNNATNTKNNTEGWSNLQLLLTVIISVCITGTFFSFVSSKTSRVGKTNNLKNENSCSSTQAETGIFKVGMGKFL